MKVNELIREEDIKNWKTGDVITIKGGTGSGKSYFIKNDLYEYAKDNGKKILMLIHRRNCVNQFEHEIKSEGKEKHISVSTYHSIEERVKNHKPYNFNKYDYIVCDEFHYFMSDANFNKYTDISLNAILEQKNKIRIFMSATGNYMKQYMNEVKRIEPLSYNLPIDYKFISKLDFFYKNDVFEQLVQKFIDENKKAIIFIKSVKDAYQLHKKFENYTMFNCSRQNKYFKYVDKDKLSNMLINEKFDDPILITTTSLDAGVNIHDDDLNDIVVGGIQDIGTIIQCVGRKRLKPDDTIDLYIQGYSNKRLGGFKGQMTKRIEKAEYVRKYGTEAYIKKYTRNTNDNIVYDNPVIGEDKAIKEVNEMIFFKNRVDIVEFDKMIRLGKFGFSKYVAKLFGFYNKKTNFYEYGVVELNNKNKNLEEYLESIVGEIMLTAKDRQELIEKVNVRDGNNNRLLKNIDTLNAKLNECGIDYIIVQFSTSRVINGKKKNFKSAWKVRRIID